MRKKQKTQCYYNRSLRCNSLYCPVCPDSYSQFYYAALEWIITLPIKIPDDQMVWRCDIALCFKGRSLAVKFFENYKVTKRICDQLLDAANEFSVRMQDYNRMKENAI